VNHSIKFIIVLLIIPLVYSCSKYIGEDVPALTPEEKSQVEVYSQRLVQSINDFDYSVITETWNNDAFKTRVRKHTRVQKSVFDHLFEKQIKMTIKIGNLALVDLVHTEKMDVSIVSIDHLKGYSELILLISFPEGFDFFKYRIEMIDQQPSLSDYYQYKDNLWYSEKITKVLLISTKHNIFSEERHLAEEAIISSDLLLSSGDTLEALKALYIIPKSFMVGNWISLKKLKLASSLNDSIFAEVLNEEHANNKSLYLRYLYNFHFNDSTNNETISKMFQEEIGASQFLDSLIQKGGFWY